MPCSYEAGSSTLTLLTRLIAAPQRLFHDTFLLALFVQHTQMLVHRLPPLAPSTPRLAAARCFRVLPRMHSSSLSPIFMLSPAPDVCQHCHHNASRLAQAVIAIIWLKCCVTCLSELPWWLPLCGVCSVAQLQLKPLSCHLVGQTACLWAERQRLHRCQNRTVLKLGLPGCRWALQCPGAEAAEADAYAHCTPAGLSAAAWQQLPPSP